MQHEVSEHGSNRVFVSKPERWTQPDAITLVIVGLVQEVGQLVNP
jgi:hypothetical protein